MRATVRKLGEICPRSIRPIVSTLTSAASASWDCAKPKRSRAALILLPRAVSAFAWRPAYLTDSDTVRVDRRSLAPTRTQMPDSEHGRYAVDWYWHG